ncbi:MAG: helix-turn-helix transcriptional regulator [Treponema sp.]|jgi:transcriptional regulator with XRE-family HTH domain|nr:helix-turn-helix transcriptional regulator [Treponema sp.]
MQEKAKQGGWERLRTLLSLNIKNRRRLLGLSQEKLAEAADISAQSVNDIEGCRMWVSDQTMVKLAKALRVEVYQLLLPCIEEKIQGETPESLHFPAETLLILQRKIKKYIDQQFYETLRADL